MIYDNVQKLYLTQGLEWIKSSAYERFKRVSTKIEASEEWLFDIR